MASIFRNLDSSVVVRDPFPHICIEGALDEELCRQLATAIPPIKTFTKGRDYPDNHKLHRRAAELLADSELPDNWRRIVTEHVNADVFKDMLRLFRADIASEYPALENKLASPSLHVGVRRRDSECDVAVDAQLMLHMPVRGPARAERGPHVKGPEKLFEGVLCLRSDSDSSSGGDFILHRIRPNVSPIFGERHQTETKYLTTARIIPRRRNTFLFWLNTPRSITQVTPRGTSPFPSVYFNILAQVPQNLFELQRGATA